MADHQVSDSESHRDEMKQGLRDAIIKALKAKDAPALITALKSKNPKASHNHDEVMQSLYNDWLNKILTKERFTELFTIPEEQLIEECTLTEDQFAGYLVISEKCAKISTLEMKLSAEMFTLKEVLNKLNAQRELSAEIFTLKEVLNKLNAPSEAKSKALWQPFLTGCMAGMILCILFLILLTKQ